MKSGHAIENGQVMAMNIMIDLWEETGKVPVARALEMKRWG